MGAVNKTSKEYLSEEDVIALAQQVGCEAMQTFKAATAGNGYKSNEEYRQAIRTQQGLETGPRDAQLRPLTAAQDLGWQKDGSSNTARVFIHGKKSCPETVYASELVKSGRFF